MNKVLALMTVLCLSGVVLCQGPPPPPAQGSVAQILQTCMQVNYIPNDQDHKNFIDQQVRKFCGNPPPNGQVEASANQLNWVNGNLSCVQGLTGGSASLKDQVVNALNCAKNQINANASASAGFVQKKAAKLHATKKAKPFRM